MKTIMIHPINFIKREDRIISKFERVSTFFFNDPFFHDCHHFLRKVSPFTPWIIHSLVSRCLLWHSFSDQRNDLYWKPPLSFPFFHAHSIFAVSESDCLSGISFRLVIYFRMWSFAFIFDHIFSPFSAWFICPPFSIKRSSILILTQLLGVRPKSL